MAPRRAYASSTVSVMSPRRPRKSTAVARREEKAALLHELEVLRAWLRLRRHRDREQRLSEIKQQTDEALRRDDEAGAAALVEASTFDARTVAKAATLLRLQGAVRDCHLLVSSARGLLGAHTASSSREALFTTLQLPADAAPRRETLRLCHAQTIRDADAFIRARSTGMDPLAPFASQERFQDPVTGDLCGVYFEVTQFPGVRSVREMYDAMRFWCANLEICVSEQLGDVTVREDTEDDEDDTPTPLGPAFSSVRRVRSDLACGASMCSSQAVFAQVFDDDDTIVVAVQPVDADARAVRETKPNGISFRPIAVVRVALVDGCVVLTRWVRIQCSAVGGLDHVTTPQLRAALTAGVGRWFEVFQRVVWDQLNAAARARQMDIPQPVLYDLR